MSKVSNGIFLFSSFVSKTELNASNVITTNNHPLSKFKGVLVVDVGADQTGEGGPYVSR